MNTSVDYIYILVYARAFRNITLYSLFFQIKIATVPAIESYF